MDLNKLRIKPIENQRPSLMRSISYMWIISGVVLTLVGLWTGGVYFLVAPLRAKLVATASQYPNNAVVLDSLNLLPYACAFLLLLAAACLVSGFSFKRFKPWALSAVHSLSYLMILVAGGMGVIWVRLWMFSISHSTENLWNYVGMFFGVLAFIVYIGINAYFIKTLRQKEFREAYMNKIIV